MSEVVANAGRHGSRPVRMRLWSGADRIVVAVSDAGSGPREPFAGLLPTGDGAAGGLGLWIAHQSCDHVTVQRDTGGFTVRLTAGNPHHADPPAGTAAPVATVAAVTGGVPAAGRVGAYAVEHE